MEELMKDTGETKESGDLVQDVYAYLSEHVIYLFPEIRK